MRRAGGFERCADLRYAAKDRAGFRGRAAHVEREHVVESERAPDVCRSDHAARGAALDQRRRPARRALQHRHPAVGPHDEDRRLHAGGANAARDALEIRLHDRSQRGVDDRGGKPLVLAVLRIDLRRQRHLDVRDRRAQRLGDLLLVCAVGIGVEQAHGNGLDAAFGDRRDGAADARRVERDEHAAVVRAALAHDEPVLAPRERLGPGDVQVVDRAAVLPPDLQHVAKPFGGDERDARQLEMHLPEQRVRRNGAGVRDERDLAGRNFVQQRPQRIEQTLFRRARRRRHLVPHKPPVVGQRNEVGERPADVDPDAPAHAAPMPRNASCTRGSPIRSFAAPLSTTRPVWRT